MWEIPKKYHTECVNALNGNHIQHLNLEAINEREAETRAYLNCLIANNDDKNIRIEVRKL